MVGGIGGSAVVTKSNVLNTHVTEEKMAFQVEVDNEKCIGCGECVDICPEDVYEMQDEKSVPVNAENCVGCESCIEVCEQDAIAITEM